MDVWCACTRTWKLLGKSKQTLCPTKPSMTAGLQHDKQRSEVCSKRKVCRVDSRFAEPKDNVKQRVHCPVHDVPLFLASLSVL